MEYKKKSHDEMLSSIFSNLGFVLLWLAELWVEKNEPTEKKSM